MVLHVAFCTNTWMAALMAEVTPRFLGDPTGSPVRRACARCVAQKVRQLWWSNLRLLRIDAWCGERMPLGGPDLATRRAVAGKRFCILCSVGACVPASGRHPSLLRTGSWSSARWHWPKDVMSRPRCRVNTAWRPNQRCHTLCEAGARRAALGFEPMSFLTGAES